MDILLQIIFWLGLLYLAYVEVLYLLILVGLSKLRPAQRVPGDAQPTVTVLIAAHNEANVIRERMENILLKAYIALGKSL